MSFILRLFNKKKQVQSNPQQHQQQQQQQQHQQEIQQGAVIDALYTQDDDGFVNICRSTSAALTEEGVDISKWEMAKVFGGQRNAVMATQCAEASVPAKSLDSNLRANASKPSGVSDKVKPLELKDEPPMEASLELDMYDDKRNRIIKRSNRRKFNFESKLSC